jgi:WD40 repeat protein
VAGHTDNVWDAYFSGDERLIASGSEDCAICIWDVEKRSLLKTLRGHTGRTQYVRFSPEKKLLLCGAADGTTRLWNIEKQSVLQKWATRYFAPVAFSHDGDCLAVGGADGGTVSIYRTDTRELLREFPIPADDRGTRSFAFCNGNTAIALGGYRGTLRVMDIASGQTLANCPGHSGEVTYLDLSDDGTRMLSAGYDTTVRMWDVSSGKELQSFKGGAWPIWRVRFVGTDRALAWGGDGEIHCFDLTSGKERWRVPVSWASSVEFSREGKLALIGDPMGGVRLWTLPSVK